MASSAPATAPPGLSHEAGNPALDGIPDPKESCHDTKAPSSAPSSENQRIAPSSKDAAVLNNGPLQISEQDDRLYRHITLPNEMQVLLIHDADTDKEAAAMDVRVGQTSDPAHLQGTAHFCEHMLFLGTGKYPDENCYSAFLNSNGGSSNAYTADEDTNYFFDVNAGHLDEALDIFSRFFVDPLFTESATGRELMAIDNENSKNLMSDPWRLVQVLKAASSPDHPWHQFGTGNAKTLGENPKEAGVDVRAELLKFHGRYYSSNLMRLAVLGRSSLDELQNMVVEKFSQVVNTNASPPSFNGKVPFGPAEVKRRIDIVPVKETREIMMTWPMPPIDKYYRSKPDGYLSHLVGHEGKGSLLSLLKAKGWANGLSAGPYESATDWSNFIVSVECTEAGIDHVDEIVTMTYQYLDMVKEDGIQEWIFRETQAIAAMNFRFCSKGNPMGYVSRLSGNMQIFPPELSVAGPSLLYDFDPDLLRELMGYIVPSNMILVVIGREFKGKTDKIEPWYRTEYSCELLPDELIASWESCGRREELRLPEPNPVIATDFDLRPPPPAGAPPGPMLVRDDVACRVWHKSDGTFRKPKLNVRIRLVTPVLYESPESMVLAALLVSLLKEDLNEDLYMSRQAGLGLELYHSAEALNISLGGYSHKMKVLLERVVGHLASFADTLAHEKDEDVTIANDPESEAGKSNADAPANGNVQGLFQRVRQKLLERYKNYEFNTPYQHAMHATQCCVEVPKWSDEDRLRVMEGPGITVAAMLAFIPRLLTMLHIEILVHGNVTAIEALELADVVVKGIAARPLPLKLWPSNRVVDLSASHRHRNNDADAPAAISGEPISTETTVAAASAAGEENSETLGPEYRWSLTCPNPEETNSAVEVTFQVCLDGVRERALLALFTHLVKDKCFDQLRTKEQLGYLVWSGRSSNACNAYNARFLIQSNDRSPRYLDQRVEAFVKGFRETLTSMTPEAFAVNVRAVVDLILEKDKNLSQETGRYWGEIATRFYVFDRTAREAVTVAALSLADLLEFYDTNFAGWGAGRRKLATWVYGNQHSMDTDEAPETSETEPRGGGEDKEGTEGDESGSGGDGAATGGSPRAYERKVVIITDHDEFKRSMPLLPLKKTSPVAAVMEPSKL